MKAFFDGISQLCGALNSMVRPYLTLFIASLYNIILAWAVTTRLLTINEYIVSIGPTNAMIIGFWFAEKAALKDPRTGRDVEYDKAASNAAEVQDAVVAAVQEEKTKEPS